MPLHHRQLHLNLIKLIIEVLRLRLKSILRKNQLLHFSLFQLDYLNLSTAFFFQHLIDLITLLN